MTIIADIPGIYPQDQFTGYSRAGVWHVILEADHYGSGPRYTCPDMPFSKARVDCHYAIARKSIEQQKALETAIQALVKSPKPPVTKTTAVKATMLKTKPEKRVKQVLTYTKPAKVKKIKPPPKVKKEKIKSPSLSLEERFGPKRSARPPSIPFNMSEEFLVEMNKQEHDLRLARKARAKKASDARWQASRDRFNYEVVLKQGKVK